MTQIEFVKNGVTFITAKLYAELSGYTVKAITRKFEEKIWGHSLVFRSPDGELMVNINNVELWIISNYLKGRKK